MRRIFLDLVSEKIWIRLHSILLDDCKGLISYVD